MIQCFCCPNSAEGNSSSGGDIINAGYYLIVTESREGWHPVCPDCYAIIREHAKAILHLFKDYVYLRYFVLDSPDQKPSENELLREIQD